MKASSWRQAWAGLWLLYIVLAVGFSIIQPLGRTPDESAHVDYIKFLAEKNHFPVWKAQGGGEGGYESQHPPLYYGITSIVYRLTAGVKEATRWQLMRWFTILLVGVPLFWISRRFFTELFPSSLTAFAATATVALMPLTQLYTGYINPDGMAALWVTLALYLTWRARAKDASLRLYWLLGAVCGLALLTKLSGFPALLVALGAQFLPGVQSDEQEAPAAAPIPLATRCGMILGTCLLVSGWWYVRNTLLYGTPFIHTEGKLGTGLQQTQASGFGATAWFTWRETTLSTFAQRGWFPAGFWEIALYAIVFAVLAVSICGLWKAKSRSANGNPWPHCSALRLALILSVVLNILIFLGQQWAFWTQDVEFNAGGRYMLCGMAGIALWMVSGWDAYPSKTKRLLAGIWVGALVVMNLISAWNIDTVLNPTYAPNTEYFHFPPGEER